ncbi:MAG: regulatory protein RecX [Lentisphaeria bacterium]|nr:regulatory protein RecX [Lentisphaeria bacterium]
MPTEPEIPAPRKQPSASEKAMRLLARRAYSERELTRKLYSYGCYSTPQIREALDYCRKNRFLNDELLAQDYARSLSDRNCGNFKIRMQLRKRGVPEPVAENAMAQIAESEPEAARRACEYKLRLLVRERDPFKKRQKLYRYLASRGFSADVIRQCIDPE